MSDNTRKLDIIKRFGVDPFQVGNCPRGWWILTENSIDEEDEQAGAMVGDLCVKTRDGASNPICTESIKKGNCVGTVEDGFNRTYRYYYYRPRR